MILPNRHLTKSQGFTPRNPSKNPETKINPSSYPLQTPSKASPSKNDEMVCSEIEASIELFEILTAIPDKVNTSEDLLALLADQGSYQDKIDYQNSSRNIHMVSLNGRQKGKNLLENISPEFRERLLENKTSSQAFTFLKNELDKVGLSVDTIDYKPPISHDTRHIIRMEFNGSIYEPDEDHLSDAYWSYKKDSHDISPKPEEYHLEDSASWISFKQFPNFRNMEDEFRHALAWGKIPPQMVRDLNSFDFEDLLFQYRKETDIYGAEKSSYRLFEGARESAVKIHTHNHKTELAAYFKELGAADDDIKKVLFCMENKGKIPPLALPNGDYLTATVHHDDAILDTDPTQDITQTNASHNFRIVFRKNAQDDEQTEFAINKENSNTKFFKERKFAVSQDVDLSALAISADKRQEFIQQFTLDNFKEIYMLFAEMGLKDPKQAVTTMMQQGEFPQLDLPNNQIIGLDIKQSKRGTNLIFRAKEKPSRYADIHANIFHGLRTSPVYMTLTQDGQPNATAAIALDNEHFEATNKQAYALEENGSSLQNLARKVMFRIHTKFSSQEATGNDKVSYIAFILGGLKKSRTIFANKDDFIMAQNRHDEIQKGNKNYDSRREFKHDR